MRYEWSLITKAVIHLDGEPSCRLRQRSAPQTLHEWRNAAIEYLERIDRLGTINIGTEHRKKRSESLSQLLSAPVAPFASDVTPPALRRHRKQLCGHGQGKAVIEMARRAQIRQHVHLVLALAVEQSSGYNYD